MSQFTELGVLPGDIVFLGDSITEGGLWSEWFSEVPTRNRGVSGDTTAEVSARLDTATHPQAAAIFLLIGTNDVTLSVPDREIVDNIDEILRDLRRAAPGSALFVQSIMPRHRRLAGRLSALNGDLERLARKQNITWIDLWPALSGGDGAIKPEFSLDRIHLTGAGYAAWVRVLRPHVESVHEPYRSAGEQT